MKLFVKQIIAFIALLLAFTSCLTTRQTNLLQKPDGTIPSYPQKGEIGEYRIKSGDELNVRIQMSADDSKTRSLFSLFNNNTSYSSGEGNKLRTFSVSPQGYIYFPYIDSLYVAGKTVYEVQNELSTKITTELLNSEACLVQVRLDNRFFSIIGESKSGRYPIAKEQLTIYQALSQAGDIKLYGNRAQVKVIRKTQTGVLVHTFDLRSSDIVNSEFYYIQPNDIIYIQPLARQFWGISSFAAIFSFISSIAALGFLTYSVIPTK